MRKKIEIACLAAVVVASANLTNAQPAKVYRIGVVFDGGAFYAVIDGLKDGLKELGFVEGSHFVLEIRDLKGDRNAADGVSRSLERAEVDLIYVVSTSVAAVDKRATAKVPIVFAVGADPVVAELVEGFARPGGRLTGVHYLAGDLTAKRLEILKTILPDLRRAVTFYDPSNEVALKAAESARAAALQLRIELVERHVASVDELRQNVIALKAGKEEAYFYTNDAMVLSQAQFIIDTARAKKLPTIFGEQGLVAKGALVAYGVSYDEVGRLSAKYVQRILSGTSPRNLPVESLGRVGLAVNLATARELGITIPQGLLLRADKVIQ